MVDKAGVSAVLPVRLGIVGLGGMGTEMLRAASGHPDIVVSIAADLNAEAVERQRRLRPDVAFTTSPNDVVHGDIDAIYIATPPAFHAELTIASLRRGIAVFCEKPLAVDLTDGQEMVAAAGASGAAACAVNFALSDRHAVLEVERAMKAGELGHVTGVEVHLRFPRWPRDFQADAAWLAARPQGGLVREVFSHFAYLTDRLLGPLHPVHVGVDYAAGRPDGAETAARGFLRASGVPVHLSAFAGLAGDELYEWIIWGTQRSYMLRDWDQLFASDGGAWVPVALSRERGTEATRLSLFARAVRGETVDNLADFAAAYRVQQVVEVFHRASAERGP